MQLSRTQQSPFIQQHIAALKQGDKVELLYEPPTRFNRFVAQLFIQSGNQTIGLVPKDVISSFVLGGILQKADIRCGGLRPCGHKLVTCELLVQLSQPEYLLPAPPVQSIKIPKAQSFLPSIYALPPKRQKIGEKRPVKGAHSPVSGVFKIPVYRREWFILLTLLLLPPLGAGLLIAHSRREGMNKLAWASLGLMLTCSMALGTVLLIFTPLKTELQPEGSPSHAVLMRFLLDWNNSNWDEMEYTARSGDTQLKGKELKALLSKQALGDFQIIDSTEFQKGKRVSYLVSTKDKKGKEAAPITIDLTQTGQGWFVDLTSLSHELYDEPLEKFYLFAPSQKDEILKPVYIEPAYMLYHLRKGCAPENAIKKDLAEALFQSYSPCPKCAR
jgi:hypothetical protein